MASWEGLSLAILVSVLVFVLKFYHEKSAGKFPPGPPVLPLIGNIHQIPEKLPFLTFAEWGRTFGASSGGLVGLRLGPFSRLLILNKAQHLKDLVDSRGTIYSDRMRVPGMMLTQQLRQPGTVYAHNFLFSQYDDTYKRVRRASLGYLRSRDVVKLVPMQEVESTVLVAELAASTGPAPYNAALLRYFGSVVLATTFGARGPGPVSGFLDALHSIVSIMVPTSGPPPDLVALVSQLPRALNPWAGWLAQGRDAGAKHQRFYRGLYAPGASPMLKVLAAQGFSDDDALCVATTLVEGGTETTSSTCSAFVLAMLARPDVQARARAEVDALWGEDTMPHAVDLNKMPYLRAVFDEIIRWRPPVPAMHRARQDDTYAGFRVGRGTGVLMNMWAMLHDADVYERPDEFLPERFLASNPGGPAPAPALAFGAGLRVCPGQRMAENALGLAMSKLLWAFDMAPAGAAPVDTALASAFDVGFTMCAREVPACFSVRGEVRAEVIRREKMAADEFLAAQAWG